MKGRGLAGALLAAACAHSPGHMHGEHGGPVADQPAQLFDDLGSLHHAISTQVADAQRYFDQGLRLVYAFNHDESIRSFRACAALDPRSAMCEWGVALASGPHINTPTLDPERARAAWEAIQKARALAAAAPPVERAYVEALVSRY